MPLPPPPPAPLLQLPVKDIMQFANKGFFFISFRSLGQWRRSTRRLRGLEEEGKGKQKSTTPTYAELNKVSWLYAEVT